MTEGFSGKPLARWSNDHRRMILEEDFFYIDPDGKKWEAPKGSELNGATIPRQLWVIVGPPYVGKYRRASIVHDVHVGEGANKDVSKAHRTAADRMFYHACLADGCSKKFARMLYIGVRIGTLVSKDEFLEESVSIESEFIDTRSISPEDSEIVSNFWKLVDLQTAPTEDRISDLGLETFDSESGGETAESEIDFDNLDSEIERLFS